MSSRTPKSVPCKRYQDSKGVCQTEAFKKKIPLIPYMFAKNINGENEFNSIDAPNSVILLT